MSKAWKILESIGEIDDKFVLEGHELPGKAPNRLIGLMPLAVACLAMVFAFVFLLTREVEYTSPAFDITEWEHLPRLHVSETVAWSGWQTSWRHYSDDFLGFRSDNSWRLITEPTLPVFRNPVIFEQSIDYTEEFLIETIEAIASYFDITISRINIRNTVNNFTEPAPMGFHASGNNISRWFEVFDKEIIGLPPRMRLDIFRGEISVRLDNYVPFSGMIDHIFENFPFIVDWSDDENINALLRDAFFRVLIPHIAYGWMFEVIDMIDGNRIIPTNPLNLPTMDWIHITLPNMLLSQHIGDYPIITPEEALEQLLQGNYISTFHYTYWPGDELAKNAHVELVYRSFELDYVFMPFYLFKIAIPEWHGVAERYENYGITTYGWWWVPAVHSELLYR